MKITLIYPPANIRNSEAFPLPSLSIAVLAKALKVAGHKAFQADIEMLWQKDIKRLFNSSELKLISNKKEVIAYILGKKKSSVFEKLSSHLLKNDILPKADLYAITFADMDADPLMLNVCALLAYAIKKFRKKPIVVGYRTIPKEAYKQIMDEYPIFDYAVYSQDGEKALLAIVDKLSDSNTPLIETFERKKNFIIDHEKTSSFAFTPSPFFQMDVIKKYIAYDSEIFSRYNSAYPPLEKLLQKDERNLVLPYSFETTCPGACAFCSNNNEQPSNAKPVGQVLEELSELKVKGATGIYFVNSAFNNKYKYAQDLCDGMIKHKFNFLWSDCANMREIDENLLGKMKLAGAVKLTFGMETASPRLLKYIRKGATIGKIRKYLVYSNRIGIWNHMEFIGGMPTESENDILATINFIKENLDNINVYSLNPFSLYPGSPFYRDSKKFGLILHPEAENVDYLKSDEKVGNFSERFDEIKGMKWNKKTAQIMDSTRLIAKAIGTNAGDKWIDFEHIHLLMSLYRKLGHNQKPLIKKIMDIMTYKFKPYHCDFFLSDINYNKHNYQRVLDKKQK
ncbi:MAG: radical SAM protein [Elusimicrobia bacterium]|nr:radical SAM protein [Elusimicrobiota bacterium]